MFNRQPSAHEWAGLEGNAARIRRIDLDVGHLCRNNLPLVRLNLKRALRFLGVRYSQTPLLPHLEQLTCAWGQGATYQLCFASLAQVPNVHCLPADGSEAMSLYGILQNPSSLRFASLIRLRNASIRSSSAVIWPKSMLNALTWAPEVENLTILNGGKRMYLEAIDAMTIPLTRLPLEVISLHVDDLVRALPFMQLVVREPLRHLSVKFSKRHTTKTFCTLLKRLFKAVGESHAQTLKILEVCGVQGLTLRHREAGAVDITILGPLCSLHNLQILHIDAACRFHINDKDVLTMALAWPSLKRLCLGSHASKWLHSGRATLGSLWHFALHCPDVRELKFAFDATTIPDEAPRRGPDLCLLEKLDVCDSPISDPTNVALHLARIFPKISSVDAAESPHSRKWEEVRSRVLTNEPHPASTVATISTAECDDRQRGVRDGD